MNLSKTQVKSWRHESSITEKQTFRMPHDLGIPTRRQGNGLGEAQMICRPGRQDW
jgi:hypothetical protein